MYSFTVPKATVATNKKRVPLPEVLGVVNFALVAALGEKYIPIINGVNSNHIIQVSKEMYQNQAIQSQYACHPHQPKSLVGEVHVTTIQQHLLHVCLKYKI